MLRCVSASRLNVAMCPQVLGKGCSCAIAACPQTRQSRFTKLVGNLSGGIGRKFPLWHHPGVSAPALIWDGHARGLDPILSQV
jgi:hypothetical protein